MLIWGADHTDLPEVIVPPPVILTRMDIIHPIVDEFNSEVFRK